MRDRLFVPFPLLKLDDALHTALGMLDDGCLDFDKACWENGVSADCVVARAELVDLGECKAITNVYVVETGDGEEVARGEEMAVADDGGNDVVRGLRADEGERGCGRG